MVHRDTRERILDAAERLFARGGIGSTSLRSITAEAEVNLAAVHYHFGSKEALVESVFERRLKPVNEERLRRLTASEANGCPPLESVIEAFVMPVLELRHDPARGGAAFMCLMGRLFSEPIEQKRAIIAQFQEVSARFTTALARALPELAEDELEWRKHFMIGAMAHTAGASDIIGEVSGGLCDPTDVQATVRRLTAFAAAGMRAPTTLAPDDATRRGVAR